MEARVYRSTGSWYVVKTHDGAAYNARVKGKLKIDGNITSTNPVTVGDRVIIEVEDEDLKTAIIAAVVTRENYINRQSPSHKYQHHIIAANLHQTMLICTLRDPKTSQGFIDRFLIAAESFHIPAIIVFNKSDIYRDKEKQRFEDWKAMYETAGYTVLLTSVKEKDGLNLVADVLKDKTTLISGHSGVGKSSLINSVMPGIELKTQDVSNWSGKGMHTTTFAEMFDLPSGGCIIDTPGIREFGLVDIPKQELSHYFPEMRLLLQDCQFNNCLHYNEPGCAVKQAVADELLSEDRYISYLTILDSIVEKKW